MRRAAIVLAVWIAVVLAAIPLALRQSDELSGGGYEVSGSQAERTEALLADQVPADFRPTVLAGVLVAPRGTQTADYRAAVSELAAAAKKVPGVKLDPVAAEFALAGAEQSPGRPVVVPLTVAASEFDSFDVADELRERLRLSENRSFGAVELHLVGAGALWAGMLDRAQDDLHQAELLAFPLVLLILLVVFGSLAAAALPLALGAAAVTISGALIYLLSTQMLMNVFVPNLALMIGLGVAVDYALFVLVRYREELAAGASRVRAREKAMTTSGTAVLWSGVVLILALASLLLVDAAAVRSLALGAILVVGVALLACVSLLPALLTLFGDRLGAGRDSRGTGFARLTAAVQRRSRRALAGSLAAITILAAPALALEIGDGALRQLPPDDRTRIGFEQAAEVTGPGRGAPLKLLLVPGAVDRTVAFLREDPEVVRVGVRTRTEDGSRVLIVATPRRDGDALATKALVRRVRAELPRGSLVGGNSAAQVDFDAEVSTAMLPIAIWIVVLTALALLFALRALPLAIGAVLTNLLSVAAAFGVLTAVFVWGWLDWLGLDSPGYVDTITIPLIFAVVFGLSMDYQVFLLRRIRERWLATGDTRLAVSEGVTSSARTITSAAVVMVAVFATFVVTGLPAVKEIGLGAGVAVAIDATLVRLVLVPAAMTLAGERCWWLPRWLHRILERPAKKQTVSA